MTHTTRTRATVVLGAAVVFLAGWWAGHQTPVQAQSTRVFEIRTYTANEGKIGDLHAMFKKDVVRLLEKHGMQSVGYWSPTDAPLSRNTMIYIVAHTSRDAAKTSWDGFRNDPEWKQVQQAADANGRVVGMVDSVYATATDYSPIR